MKNTEMGWYVNRGLESDIINSLNNYGVACLIGFPGVGKTTTARYVGVKLSEEKNIVTVCLSLDRGEGVIGERKIIEFPDERGRKHKIRLLPILSGFEEVDYAKALAYLLVKIVNGSFFEKVSEPLQRSFEKYKISEKGSKIGKILERAYAAKTALEDLAEELGKHVHNLIGEDTKKSVDEFVEKAKKFLEDYGVFEDLPYMIFDFSCYMLTGAAGVVALKSIRRLIKRKLKLKKEVIFIFDDIRDLEGYMHNFYHFLEWLIESGAKVIMVKRLNVGSESDYSKYMELVRFMSDEAETINLDEIVFSGAERFLKWREQVFLIDSPSLDVFKDMLEANIIEIENVETIYRASAGAISVALMLLDAGISIEGMRESVRTHRYFTIEEIYAEKDEMRRREMILSNKNVLLTSIYKIYEKLRRENACLLILFVQDVAKEELEKFCEHEEAIKRFRNRGYNLFPNLEDYNWIVEIYYGKWKDEDGNKYDRIIYTLNENWKKFRVFVDGLTKFHGKRDEVLRDIVAVRKIMLEIMTKELEDVGATARMAYFSLKNAKFLWEKRDGIDVRWVSECLAYWCGFALQSFPNLGLLFKDIALKAVEEGVKLRGNQRKYLRFLYYLVGRLRAIERDVTEFEEMLERFEGDEIIETEKMIIKSMIISKKPYIKAESEFKELMSKLDKLKGNLRNYVEIAIKLNWVETLLSWNKAEEAKELLEGVMKSVEGLLNKADKNLIEYFKAYEGDARKKLEESLRLRKASAYYNYAKALMMLARYTDRDKLEETTKYFEEARKIYEESENSSEALKCLSRICKVRAVMGEYDFKDVFEKTKDIIHTLDDFTYSGVVAEYLISKDRIESKELVEGLTPYFRRIALPMLHLKSVKRVDAIRLLEEFEVEIAYPNLRESLAKILSLLSKSAWKMDEEFERFKRGKSLHNTEFLPLAKEVILRLPPISSLQAFARVLRLYLLYLDQHDESYLNKALEIAESEAKAYSNLPSSLFVYLAEALKSLDKAKVVDAFMRLFYCHC